MEQLEAAAEQRTRGYITKVMAAGFAFVAEEESGEECFLHVREFRKAVISWSGLFVVGTFLEFTKEPATPRPRAVKVKVLS